MPQSRRSEYFFYALLGILLIGVYSVTFTADFLPWDDDYNISINPIYQHGTWLSFWTQAFYGMYIPLTSSLWGVLFDLGQGSPLPFRIFNFTLHLANTWLVAVFLKTWTQKLQLKNSWLWMFGTALFALHPMQVETVAWISGGRDLLSTTLALLAALAYFRWPGRKGFAIGSLCFALGLLSKPQMSALPLAIFLLSLLSEPRKWKSTAAQMAVWCLPVLAIMVVTFTEQKQYVNQTVDPLTRLIVMADAYGFYLSKLFWPGPLMVDYGRSPRFVLSELSTHWPLMALFLLTLLALTIWTVLKKEKTLAWLFLTWIACLLPVSGLVDFAYQDISTTADHYVYFPMIAFSLLMIFLLSKAPRSLGVASLVFVLAAGSALSWNRAQVWKDRFAFFEDMLRGNADSYSALIGLGGNASLNSDNEKALQYYKSALEKRPFDVAATANILASLFRLQRFNEVLQWESFILQETYYQTMKVRHVAAANILSTLGSASFVIGNMDLSLFYICEASALNPYSPGVQRALAQILTLKKQKDPQFRCAQYASDEEFLRAAAASQASRARK